MNSNNIQRARDFLLSSAYVVRQKEEWQKVSTGKKVKRHIYSLTKKCLKAVGLLGFVKKIASGILPPQPSVSPSQWGHDPSRQIYFYQSFPALNIKGARPIDYRIKVYRFGEFLNDRMNVLDIGCNTGFLDMTIADRVKTVAGIEYDQELAQLAQETARILEISNATFYNADFNQWHKENSQKKYDVVLSFAVHHWLGVDAEGYADVISSLLNPGGYLVFESHNLGIDIGNDFEEFSGAFCKRGLKECFGGVIHDAEDTNRRWAVFRKE